MNSYAMLFKSENQTDLENKLQDVIKKVEAKKANNEIKQQKVNHFTLE